MPNEPNQKQLSCINFDLTMGNHTIAIGLHKTKLKHCMHLLRYSRCINAFQCKCCPLLGDTFNRSKRYIKLGVQNINYLQYLIAYLRLWLLTGVSHRNPLVELIVVRHSVKLTAQHLPKSWLILLTGFCVTCPITLPFPSAVLAPKLWSVEKSFLLRRC